LVAREPRLLLARDRVDVRRADRGGGADLAFAGPFEQTGQDEPGSRLVMRVDHGVERVEPFAGLDWIGIGQLVHVAVEDHAAILAPFPPRTDPPQPTCAADPSLRPRLTVLGCWRLRVPKIPAAHKAPGVVR